MTTDSPKRASRRALPREVKASVEACREKMAEDIVVLDLRGLASFTDFFVVLNGNSVRQNLAICEHVERELRAEGFRSRGLEGRGAGDWILMDYGHFIVHIFSREKRGFYALEKLWGDAPRTAA